MQFLAQMKSFVVSTQCEKFQILSIEWNLKGMAPPKKSKKNYLYIAKRYA